MKATTELLALAIVILFAIGCATLPSQTTEVPTSLFAGTWQSFKFTGLCAHDFGSMTIEFGTDGRFSETTLYGSGTVTELDGTYRIEGSRIHLDDGQGYSPVVPFYYDFEKNALMITRRANIGRVKVSFKKGDTVRMSAGLQTQFLAEKRHIKKPVHGVNQ